MLRCLLIVSLFASPASANEQLFGGASAQTVSSVSLLETLVSQTSSSITYIIPESVSLQSNVALLIGVADSDATTTDTIIHDADPTTGSISADLVGKPLVIMSSSAGVTRGEYGIVASVDVGADTITLDRALSADMDGATYRVADPIYLAPGALSSGQRLTIRCEGTGFSVGGSSSTSSPVLIHLDYSSVEHDHEVHFDSCVFAGLTGVTYEIGILLTNVESDCGAGASTCAGRTVFTSSSTESLNQSSTTGNVDDNIQGDRFFVYDDATTNAQLENIAFYNSFIDAQLPFHVRASVGRVTISGMDLWGVTGASIGPQRPCLFADSGAGAGSILMSGTTLAQCNYFRTGGGDTTLSNVRWLAPGILQSAEPPTGAYFSVTGGTLSLDMTIVGAAGINPPAGTELINLEAGSGVLNVKGRIQDSGCVVQRSGTAVSLVDADVSSGTIHTIDLEWSDGGDCEPITAPLSSQAESELTADSIGRIVINGRGWGIQGTSIFEECYQPSVGCLICPESDGAGAVACEYVGGAQSCEATTNDICGDAT